MNTKVVLLISLLAVPGPVLITPAIAADIEPIIEEAAAYNWTGFYVGAHVGYGEADVNGEFDQEDTGLIFGLEPNGLIGGVHAGFDWQISSFVLGVEGDFSWADWEDDIGPNIDGENASAEVDWLATLRARLGFALDNFLVYGTVGGAWADAEYTANDPIEGPPFSGSVDFDDIGLVAGGGVEWGIAENWSWKLEGLWFNFDDNEDASGLTGDSDPGDFAELDDAWLVWTGIRFRF